MQHMIEVSSTIFDKLSHLVFGDDFTHDGMPYRKGYDRAATVESIRLDKIGGQIHPNEKNAVYVFFTKDERKEEEVK